MKAKAKAMKAKAAMTALTVTTLAENHPQQQQSKTNTGEKTTWINISLDDIDTNISSRYWFCKLLQRWRGRLLTITQNVPIVRTFFDLRYFDPIFGLFRSKIFVRPAAGF